MSRDDETKLDRRMAEAAHAAVDTQGRAQDEVPVNQLAAAARAALDAYAEEVTAWYTDRAEFPGGQGLNQAMRHLQSALEAPLAEDPRIAAVRETVAEMRRNVTEALNRPHFDSVSANWWLGHRNALRHIEAALNGKVTDDE